jgi:hypothetical protein
MVNKFMDYRAPVRYWSSLEVKQMLRSLGFEVYQHNMLRNLPSPHIVHVATRKEDQSVS